MVFVPEFGIFDPLSRVEIYRIHRATLALLERTDVRFDNKAALKVLAEAGANINSKTILEQLMIHCPSCKQRVRNYSDIKQCAGWCEEKLCPSCGIQIESGGLACNRCHPKYSALKEELGSWPNR
jgi:RecJ-like exonuclease